MQTVRTAPIIGLIAAAGAARRPRGTAGLSVSVGCSVSPCGAGRSAALAPRSPARAPARLGPADWVTLARATLVVAVAALTADSFVGPAPCRDGHDLRRRAGPRRGRRPGRSAYRQRVGVGGALRHGGRRVPDLRPERVRRTSIGLWVLAIGAARYVFVAAGWLLPWLREPRHRATGASSSPRSKASCSRSRRPTSCPTRLPSPRSCWLSFCSPSRSGAKCGGYGNTAGSRRRGVPWSRAGS